MGQEKPKANQEYSEAELAALEAKFQKYYADLTDEILKITAKEELITDPTFSRAAYRVLLARAVQFAIAYGLSIADVAYDAVGLANLALVETYKLMMKSKNVDIDEVVDQMASTVKSKDMN